MDYTFTVNQQLSAVSKTVEAWVALKTLLVAAGWTVPRSSDGTTYNSSGDQGGLDNTNAWHVLQQPTGGSAPYAGTRQICLQRTTAGNTARIKYSLSSGFTGGTPGATRVPSAVDEVVLLGSGTDASPVGVTWTSTAQYRFNVVVGASSANFGFCIAGWTSGGSAPILILFDPIQSYTPGDTDPFIIHLGGSLTPTAATISVASGWGYSRMSTGVYAQLAAYQYSDGATGAPDGFGSNPINSKDDALPIPCGRRAAQANPGFKGFSTMTKWTGVARAIGDTGSVSAAKDRLILGQVSVPWDSTTVPTV